MFREKQAVAVPRPSFLLSITVGCSPGTLTATGRRRADQLSSRIRDRLCVRLNKTSISRNSPPVLVAGNVPRRGTKATFSILTIDAGHNRHSRYDRAPITGLIPTTGRRVPLCVIATSWSGKRPSSRLNIRAPSHVNRKIQSDVRRPVRGSLQ
jgi:hypothetical protein